MIAFLDCVNQVGTPACSSPHSENCSDLVQIGDRIEEPTFLSAV